MASASNSPSVSPSKSPSVSPSVSPSLSPSNPGWLSGWSYRKEITLSRAAGAVTNYTMRLIVGESSGATDEDVNCGGHCQPDFDDIRFTTSDGETLLSHYVESITGTTPNQLATIWVEFNSIGTGDTTFYMYYGKSDAVSVSVIDGTFIFGDDLSQDTAGNDPSKWTVVQGTLSLLKVQTDALALISKTICSLNAAGIRVASDGTVWAGHYTDGTIRKSTDGGATWTTKYTFSVGSGQVRCIWIAANGYLFASRDDSDILVRSTDGGENWSTCKTLSGSGDSVVWHMAQDSLGNIYVGEYSSGDGSETNAYVYKSVDNGDNWTTIWDNPDSARHIHFVAVDPYTDRLYASQGDQTDGRLFYSDNQGTNWTTIGNGSSLWHPTSIAFGSGYRLFGQDNIDAPPVLIRKTVNDADFTTAYTPPTTDDVVFWNGGEVNEDGLMVFASWTQADSERATIIGTHDGGTTWRIFDWEATGVGNRGYISVSNVDPSGLFYIPRSVETDIIRSALLMSVDNKIKASSADISQAVGTKSISFPSAKFIVEFLAASSQLNSILPSIYIDQDTTDRVAVAFWDDGLIKYHNGTDWISSGISYVTNRYYRIKYIVHLSDGIWDLYIDDVSIATSIPFRNAGTTANNLRAVSGANAQGTTYSDLITVRNYSSPEPAWGSWGAEESGLSASASPSISPSTSPSISPSLSPSASLSPSESPSISPSASLSPSESPSLSPSASQSPSVSPSRSPSVSPSISASTSPSVSPSRSPSASPSLSPSKSPSGSPSKSPSLSPSESFSRSPSVSPSRSPSMSRSASPSRSPSASPSLSPSELDVTDFEFDLWPREIPPNSNTSQSSPPYFVYGSDSARETGGLVFDVYGYGEGPYGLGPYGGVYTDQSYGQHPNEFIYGDWP